MEPPFSVILPPVVPETFTVPAWLMMSALSLTLPPVPVLLPALSMPVGAMSMTRPRATIWPAPDRPDAVTLPEIRTVPPGPPPNTMAPLRPDTERAETVPEMFTASRTALAAVAAEISTRPPRAEIFPETLISGVPSLSVAVSGTATWRNPRPVGSSVACDPAPRPTRPRGTEILPSFDTEPPSRPTKPPSPVVIVPAFDTPLGGVADEKVSLPDSKSLSLMPSVEATKPPVTLTAPVLVMAMPLGLTRNTCPLPRTVPAMVDDVVPVTRLRMADVDEGWTKVTEFG